MILRSNLLELGQKSCHNSMVIMKAQISPKYQQVYDALAQEIRTGKWKGGDRLPSEVELGAQFHASRITVGRAVKDLQHAGLVERRAGSGTYVKMQAAARAL